MSTSKSAQSHLKSVFTDGFSVADVAEPLVSFDATTGAQDVRKVMLQRAYQVVGIRQDGLVAGYVNRDDLGDGQCAEYLRAFGDHEVVSQSTSFPTAVALLADSPRLFVNSFGRASGIVTRTDLQKPPVRMWLFGMITIIEMGLTRLIEARFPDGAWKQYLSEGRLQKAEELLAERRRRDQELDLLDCLQFSDKGQITFKDDLLRERVGYQSRRRGEQTIKSLEALRNNLAHSQDIVSCDWDTIVQLNENLDRVFSI